MTAEYPPVTGVDPAEPGPTAAEPGPPAAEPGPPAAGPGLPAAGPGRPTAVYYLPAGAKQPVLIDGAVARPNGLTLTNDGKTLIVDDTIGPTVFAYDVQPDGTVKNKRTFAELRHLSAIDGLM